MKIGNAEINQTTVDGNKNKISGKKEMNKIKQQDQPFSANILILGIKKKTKTSKRPQ